MRSPSTPSAGCGDSQTFAVLAEPIRRHILNLLLERDRSVTELVQRIALDQPRVSKHLRVLREAGLVEAHYRAHRRWYHLRAEALAALDAWLAPYRRLWEQVDLRTPGSASMPSP